MNTGIYRPASNSMAFSLGGVQSMLLTNSLINLPVPWQGPDGAVALPTYNMSVNNGIYRIGSNQFGISTSGTLRLTLAPATAITATNPLITAAGTAAAPAYSFASEGNTGIFQPSVGRMAFSVGGTENFRIYGSSVGIGLAGADPSYSLQLGADSAAKPTSNTWTIYSDIRLKKDIEPIKNALDKLTSLQGVTYKWKEPKKQGNMTGTYMGLIAQDVEKVFPEWVGTDSAGYKNLTISGFQGLVPEALRELKARNAALRLKLEQQKARIEKLKRELK
jgi:hypothetical protein